MNLLVLLSVFVFSVTVVSLAIPIVGRVVANILVGIWRWLPVWLRLILAIPLVLLFVGGWMVVGGFAFREPWAAWAGFSLLAAPAILLSFRPRARRLAVSLMFLALLALGTPVTDATARTIALGMTLIAIVWLSRGYAHRFALVAVSILIVVVGIGLSYVPASITESATHLFDTGVLLTAESIEPNTPATQLEVKREARAKYLKNEITRYQDTLEGLEKVQAKRPLVPVERAQIENAEARIAMINQMLGTPASTEIVPQKARWLLWVGLAAVVILFLALIAWLVTRTPTPPAAPATPPGGAHAAPAASGSGQHGFITWPIVAAIAIGAAVLISALFVMKETGAAQPVAAGAVGSFPASKPDDFPNRIKLPEDSVIYKEDGEMITAKGANDADEVVLVTKGKVVCYGGPEVPDVKQYDELVYVVVSNQFGDCVKPAITGFIPAWKLSPTPPVRPAHVPAQSSQDGYLGYTLWLQHTCEAPAHLWWYPAAYLQAQKVRMQGQDWKGPPPPEPVRQTSENEVLRHGTIRRQFTASNNGEWRILGLDGKLLKILAPPVKDGNSWEPVATC